MQPPHPPAAADPAVGGEGREHRERPCSRGDALTRIAAVRIDLACILDVDDNNDLPIKPEEANALVPMFDLVWERQPAVLEQCHEPALDKLLLIDGCHVMQHAVDGCHATRRVGVNFSKPSRRSGRGRDR